MLQPAITHSSSVPASTGAWRGMDWPHTPLETAEGLAHLPGLAFLDTACTSSGAQSLVTAAPSRILRGNIDRNWDLISDAIRGESPGAGGLIGWVGFDGEFVFGVYPQALRFDHAENRWLESGNLSSAWTVPSPQRPVQLDFQPSVPANAYIRSVAAGQEYIRAGDIYQVNLAHPFHAPWPNGAAPLAFYRQLRQASPAPYAAYLDLDGTRVLSSSPESFLKLSGNQIETRPIKGTRPRFPGNAAQDHASSLALKASSKEQAELLMITDLERNDLGQVCEFGSVHVPLLAALESYAQVFHLASTVRGTLRSGTDHAAAFKACFPGGSISGAPKKRALEIIRELEAHPRGIYTGAIGRFGFDGESQFSIAIRTAVQRGESISFHAGAGIVADSVPELEYEETLHKAAGILRAAKGA